MGIITLILWDELRTNEEQICEQDTSWNSASVGLIVILDKASHLGPAPCFLGLSRTGSTTAFFFFWGPHSLLQHKNMLHLPRVYILLHVLSFSLSQNCFPNILVMKIKKTVLRRQSTK